MAGLLSTRGRSAVAGPKGAALLSATTLPAWLQGKAIGEWVSIPNTALADMDFSVINAAGLNPGNWQYGSPQKGIFAYSGGCVKGGNSLLLFGGGGANAWAGNEVRAIDLSADVPKWTVLIPPSPASAVWSNVNGSPEKTPHAYNKDDKPNARHSYWQPQFIDADNEFMAFGCTNEWETDSIKSLVVDSYSLNKGSWNAQGTNPAMPHRRGWDGNAQCKHPVTEDVFIAAGGYLSRWSRASNTWTDIRTVHSGMERGMMAVDPNANIVLRLGLNAPSNPCFKFDCDTGAMTPGNLVGPYAAAVNLSDAPHWGASGFTYDRGLKAFLLYQNTGQIYVLTPSGSDWNVDLLPTFGTLPEINADMSAALGGGIWGRFAYLPALNGVVFVSGTVSPPYRQNVFFVRTGDVTPVIAPTVPGTATVISNPYGPLQVTGAAFDGSTISNFSGNTVLQLGSVAGAPGSVAEIDFQSLDIGAGNALVIRSGATGQSVVIANAGAAATTIAGTLVAQGGNGAPPPFLYVRNSKGISVTASGSITALSGLGVDTLGATWMTGEALANRGVIDGGVNLELVAGRVNGGGQFKGDGVTIRTFGSANNPVNGAYYLQNGLQLYPSSGGTIALTLNAYGSAPQVLNLFVNGSASAWMPSAWPAGVSAPANNAVVSMGGVRPSGAPEPTYGGGSMILQATGSLTLVNGGTNDFVFPGAIVLKALGDLNLNAVVVNQGWTTSGQPFQGIFFESPNIVSPNGNIQVFSNDLNWMNFSTFPQAYVRAFSLKRNADTSASFVATDSTTPHINAYSVLQNAAASGGCWTCIVDPQPVNIHGPQP